jgi:hypothetical protein
MISRNIIISDAQRADRANHWCAQRAIRPLIASQRSHYSIGLSAARSRSSAHAANREAVWQRSTALTLVCYDVDAHGLLLLLLRRRHIGFHICINHHHDAAVPRLANASGQSDLRAACSGIM